MPEWTVSAVLLIILIAAGVISVWLRSCQRRDQQLANTIQRLKRAPKPGRVDTLLHKIYEQIEKNIAGQNAPGAYQSIDLLKTAFGEGLIRQDEPLFLSAIVIRAVQSKQIDIASAALDAYRQMLRHLPPEGTAAAERLGIVVAVLLREKQNFLAAKAADIILEALERELGGDRAVTAYSAALKTIGILALRRNDGGLFREIAGRLSAAVIGNSHSDQLSASVVGLSVTWLHRIVKNDNQAMFAILGELVMPILEKGLVRGTDFQLFLKEWQNIAGTACLNPNSILGEKITEFVLNAVLRREAAKEWETAVKEAGQTARLTITRRGLEDAFPVLLPLLAIGRDLLTMELKIGGGPADAHCFRPQALFYTVRECTAIAEFTARRDMIASAGDIISDINRCWTKPGLYSNHKANKRYCQLLAAYWYRISRQAKKAGLSDDLAKPALLSEEDKAKLAFL